MNELIYRYMKKKKLFDWPECLFLNLQELTTNIFLRNICEQDTEELVEYGKAGSSLRKQIRREICWCGDQASYTLHACLLTSLLS